jgi:hypothetical protein
MDLPLPPLLIEARKDELEHQISVLTLRLAENPAAPEEWRKPDEDKRAAAVRELALLNGEDLA